MNEKILIETCKASIKAQFQLEYVGYGDSWERSCAIEAKLPEKIQAALDLAIKEGYKV